MKYQESKLELKFHALFILYTYTSLNNNLALQFIIFLKSRLLFLSYSISRAYFRHLLRAMTGSNYTLFEIFELLIFQICIFFRGFSSSNCPKFTEIMSFLLIPHTCPAFQKYALITFLFRYQSVRCEDKKC